MASKRHLRRAVYPGSFDPVTNGHLALIAKASRLYDYVDVAVATNLSKDPLFTVTERVDMLKQAVAKRRNVNVSAFDGLVVDFASKKRASVIIRGLRAVSDFEMELQMALANRRMNEEIETVFLLPSEDFFYLSSGLIKEIAHLGGNIRAFVPAHVGRALSARVA